MKISKFKSLKELDAYRVELGSRVSNKRLISISAASCGRAAGALEIASALKRSIEEAGLEEKVQLKLTGCHGFCQFEPNVVIFPEKHFYPNLRPQDIPLLVEKAVLKGEAAEELAFKDELSHKRYLTVEELPFYKNRSAGYLMLILILIPIVWMIT
jgi:Ferredoxin